MKSIGTALRATVVLLIICSLIYPLSLLGLGQLFFPHQANGSMITVNSKVVGSALIGQDFTDPKYFHGRVSAVNYNTFANKADADKAVYPASGSGNLAVSNPVLGTRLQDSLTAFEKENPTITAQNIPYTLLASSGSGLDPEITPEAAYAQVPRIAKATGISEATLKELVDNSIIKKSLGVLGETRVNVLEMNIGIDKIGI